MAVPLLMPPGAGQGQSGEVAYRIEGELVPVLHLQIGNASVYFEHHILLWKEPRLEIGIKALQGAFKRMLAGMPIIMTQTQGSGGIAFSRDTPGHVFALHIPPGHSLEVREHQFLAATDSLNYSFAFVKGAANILFSGTGLFVDTFHATASEGVVFLHGSGNVFEVSLSPGEQIDVEPGGWIYKDPSVTMETKYQGLRTGILASAGQLIWNRFTGPGRVGIQSMYVPPVAAGSKG